MSMPVPNEIYIMTSKNSNGDDCVVALHFPNDEILDFVFFRELDYRREVKNGQRYSDLIGADLKFKWSESIKLIDPTTALTVYGDFNMNRSFTDCVMFYQHSPFRICTYKTAGFEHKNILIARDRLTLAIMLYQAPADTGILHVTNIVDLEQFTPRVPGRGISHEFHYLDGKEYEVTDFGSR